MCEQFRKHHETVGASKALNKTIAMVEKILGQSIPIARTPSERRDIMIKMLERHI